MNKFCFIFFLLVLLNINISYGFDPSQFQRLLEGLQKGLQEKNQDQQSGFQRGLEKILPLGDKNKQIKDKQSGQPQVKDISCRAMLDNTPKNSLINQSAKNILAGAAVGALVGAMATKERDKGAILGAIVGMAGAAAYTAATTKHLQAEDPKAVAKKFKYQPSMGEFLSLEIHHPDKREYHKGEYVEIVLKVSLLTPEALNKLDHDPIQVWVNSFIIINDEYLWQIGGESYYLKPGTYPIVYYLPICDQIIPGDYKLSFQIISLGKEVSKNVEFKVVSK